MYNIFHPAPVPPWSQAGSGDTTCAIYLPEGAIDDDVVPRQVRVERPTQCFSSNVGVCGCQFLPEGIAGALLQHALRYSCRSLSVMCYACVCFKLIFTMVYLPRVLVLPQSFFLRSGYLVTGGYVAFFAVATWSLADTFFFAAATWLLADTIAFSFAAATWLLADGCRALRSGYLVACGWMPCFLPVDALPPRLHPPFVGNLCVDVFLLIGIVGWAVEVEVPPSPLCVFFLFVLLFLYLSDSVGNRRITCESFVTVIGPFLRPVLLMKYRYKTRSRKNVSASK
jgi:hypothetical protein